MNQIIGYSATVILIGFILFLVNNKTKKGGGCCGEHEQMAKKIRVADRHKSHYSYRYTLFVEGMVCANCARKVENELNVMDGVWARVNLAEKTVDVLSKKPYTKDVFLDTLNRTVYTLIEYKEDKKE